VAPGAAYIDNPGFPSDHALLATATIVAVYAFTKNRTVTLFLMVLLLIMSIARVVALVHTPLDIVGGILAGLAGSLWYKKLTK
jgi:membrane-associated phospholipid phosphatase